MGPKPELSQTIENQISAGIKEIRENWILVQKKKYERIKPWIIAIVWIGIKLFKKKEDQNNNLLI